jgi:hypothetical protein
MKVAQYEVQGYFQPPLRPAPSGVTDSRLFQPAPLLILLIMPPEVPLPKVQLRCATFVLRESADNRNLRPED